MIETTKLTGDFTSFSVILQGDLNLFDCATATRCTEYAFKKTLAGEPLSTPNVTHGQFFGCEATRLDFAFDSRSSIRTQPDFVAAFELSEAYINFGTPVRKTNRRGPGTQGTRETVGIGPIGVHFLVSEAKAKAKAKAEPEAPVSKIPTIGEIGFAAGDTISIEGLTIKVKNAGPDGFTSTLAVFFQTKGHKSTYSGDLVLKQGSGTRFLL